MAFTRGTSSDYRDLLDKLDQFLTNRHVATVVIDSPGAGYSTGDQLTVAGGTVVGGMIARLEVTSIGATGDITGIRVFDAGAYSADPPTSGNLATGGTGSGASFSLTVADTGWLNRIRNISSATSRVVVSDGFVDNNGSGYVDGDIVTLADTVPSTKKAQFRIDFTDKALFSNSDVISISLEDEGDYETAGAIGGTESTTGGSGSGLEIRPKWIPVRDEYLWESSNGVVVGARSGFSADEDQVLWELAGFTGWNGTSDWESQPGISPGRNDFKNENGAALLLSTSTMSFWFAATTDRIIVVVDAGGNQQSAYLGLVDAFGTDAEIPYPMLVCGSSSRFNINLASAGLASRGPADPTAAPVTSGSIDKGPGFWREGDASWKSVRNGQGSSTIGNIQQIYPIYPCGRVTQEGMDPIDELNDPDLGLSFRSFIPSTRVGASEIRLLPSPDSVEGSTYWPVPCLLLRDLGENAPNQREDPVSKRPLGALRGLFWVNREGSLQVGDRIQSGSRFMRVFRMGGNTASYAHFAVEEA